MKKEKLRGFLHLIAGLIILVHGFDSFEYSEFLSASAYMGLAILFMLVAALHKSIIKRFLQGDIAFFLLEAITILYSAWHYKSLNHLIIFYLFAAAGIVYLILSIASGFIDAEKPRRKHKRRRRKFSSGLYDDVRKDSASNFTQNSNSSNTSASSTT